MTNIALLHSQMSNFLKKLTANTAFGTTELCKYCDCDQAAGCEALIFDELTKVIVEL